MQLAFKHQQKATLLHYQLCASCHTSLVNSASNKRFGWLENDLTAVTACLVLLCNVKQTKQRSPCQRLLTYFAKAVHQTYCHYDGKSSKHNGQNVRFGLVDIEKNSSNQMVICGCNKKRSSTLESYKHNCKLPKTTLNKIILVLGCTVRYFWEIRTFTFLSGVRKEDWFHCHVCIGKYTVTASSWLA